MRFERMDNIPFDLVGELTSKVSAEECINIYESTVKKA